MNTQQTINEVLNIFQSFRMPPTPIDQYDHGGRDALALKMSPFVTANVPIDFVMLGFPHKSMNNRDKVLGTMPDLGEEIALKNFALFDRLVREVYAPGVNITVVSDGYIFNDLMEVSDETVEEYKYINMDMGRGGPLQWYDLIDFYRRGDSLPHLRAKVMQQFGISAEELERRILVDPDVNYLYRGMIRFMVEDLAIKNYTSGNQLQKAAKKMAREMMLRNEAYSALIRSEFADSVRLSIHPSQNKGAKYSFQLIPSPNAHHSPWHSALLVKDGQFETLHRKDAIEAGYELVTANGRPYYFAA